MDSYPSTRILLSALSASAIHGGAIRRPISFRKPEVDMIVHSRVMTRDQSLSKPKSNSHDVLLVCYVLFMLAFAECRSLTYTLRVFDGLKSGW